MDGFLKIGVAATVKVGPFVDTSGVPVTTLSIPQGSIRLSKNGANMAQKGDVNGLVHDELGVYDCALAAGDVSALGILRIDIKPSTSLGAFHTFQVVTAEWYDKMCGSGTFTVAISSNAKKNQALAGFTFLMTDSTTHAPVTGKTVTLTRSIDGAAFAAAANAVTEVASGIYKVDLATTDLNGNSITFRATASGADDRFFTIVTQP